jgi:hypothetical protein
MAFATVPFRIAGLVWRFGGSEGLSRKVVGLVVGGAIADRAFVPMLVPAPDGVGSLVMPWRFSALDADFGHLRDQLQALFRVSSSSRACPARVPQCWQAAGEPGVPASSGKRSGSAREAGP